MLSRYSRGVLFAANMAGFAANMYCFVAGSHLAVNYVMALVSITVAAAVAESR